METLINPYSEPVNMSMSFKGLTGLIGAHMQADARCGDWFLFFNAKRDYLKALWFDGTGFNIHAKKLDHGTFPILSKRKIRRKEFDALLSGSTVTRKQVA